jgi:predicted enzyme related to lactoylglutathione lyase
MPHNAAVWFEIYVQDVERARKFYEGVFQVKLQKLNSPEPEQDLELWAFMGAPDRSGATGALVKMKGFPSGGNSTLVYFGCEDCAVEAGRVEALGGRIQRGKWAIGPYGFIALAYDTEGNMFGMHSMK